MVSEGRAQVLPRGKDSEGATMGNGIVALVDETVSPEVGGEGMTAYDSAGPFQQE